MTRLDDQCVGGGHIVPAITRKWAKGSGGPAGDEHQNLVWTGVGVNPSNTDIAGTLPSNQQGGQRTTDIAGAYVYRKSRRAQSAAVAVGGDIAHTLTKEGHDAGEDGTGRGTPIVTYNVRPEYGNGADLRVDEANVHPTLAQQTHLPGYDRGIRVLQNPAFAPTVASTLQAQVGRGYAMNAETADGQTICPTQATVRRLTPMECERLMGWPDGWTDIPWNKKDHAPDSRRYAACGNGVVAPVAFWIGARLAEVLRES